MILKKLIIVHILLFVSFLLSCSKDSQVSNPTPSEAEEVRQVGEKVTGLLLKTLQNELKTTIEEKGIVAALAVCNSRALYLTDSLAKSIGGIAEIKRTSFRYRNPKNAPDANERRVLAYFQSTLFETGQLPLDLIEKIKGETTHFRYYKPLVIKSLCLNCHGSSGMIDSEIDYSIKKRYPGDHATGYTIDQFRGLVRITLR
jgi:hypothetical protein